MNQTPLFTAILSWIMLGESLAGIQYLGMAIMVVGVAFYTAWATRSASAAAG